MNSAIPTPDTLVGTIDWEAIPESKAQEVLLPGASGANRISFSQLRMISQWVKDNYDPMLTFSEAITRFRKDAGVGPRQYDFNLCEFISGVLKKRRAENELTVAQDRLITTYMGAFSGQRPHYHTPIQQAIEACNDQIKTKIWGMLLDAFVVGKDGPFQRVMTMIENTFGKIPRRSLYNTQDAGNALDAPFMPADAVVSAEGAAKVNY